MKSITAHQFESLHGSNSNLHVVDVRSRGEYASRHLHGAACLPLDEFSDESLSKLGVSLDSSDTIYLICQSGQRAQLAANKLDGMRSKICIVNGGISALQRLDASAWHVSDKGTMSLENQIRLVAGILVTTSVLLGAFLSPLAYGLAGFVGVGLIYAALSNTCMMGMLLARAPWNRG